MESFSKRSPLNFFYLQNLPCEKSWKIISGKHKAGLSILPQFICLKIDKKFNFKKHFNKTLRKIPVNSSYAAAKHLPKNVPSVSQTFYIKVQKYISWIKKIAEKSSEHKKKNFVKSIRKTLSKFWIHSGTSKKFQNISPAKFLPDTWNSVWKTCLEFFLKFWNIS